MTDPSTTADLQPTTTTLVPEEEKKWGRVLICGGTDWANLGRKERKVDSGVVRPDLPEPHILRSLANVRIASIHASCSGCHVAALGVDGAAWLFGRNAPAALGRANAGSEPGIVSEHAPKRVTAPSLGAAKGTTIVHAAVGRNHTLLVGSNGEVWTAGANNFGQCGQPVSAEVPKFTLVKGQWPGPKEKIVKAAAGVSFSLLLSESGKVYAFGSGEHGQLGNGRTGEHIATGNKTGFDAFSEPTLVKGLQDKVITQIACGTQHSIALDKDGFVYVWGYNGYCRLGLGNQVDVLMPKAVPHFAQANELTRGMHVSAGPTNSVVIDRQKMYWMAGKWKTSGDGSGGAPYSTFRYMQDLMGCKIYHACSGGVSHFALATDQEDGSVMTIAYGQAAANSELGLGADQPKSCTKPTRHQPLIGIDVIDIAAAQNTTLSLAHPNEKFFDLPRHPVEADAPDVCVVCGRDTGDKDSPLECNKCDYPYHLGCLNPPLSSVPDGEWFCPKCAEPSADVETDEGAVAREAEVEKPPPMKKRGKKQVEQEDDEEDAYGEDVEEEPPAKSTKGRGGQKRKAAPAAPKPKATKRKR